MKSKFLLSLLVALGLSTGAGAEISNGTVKIGVLTDLSGLFSTPAGMGSVIAARMAVEDFGGKVRGKPVEVIFADHLNKPDTALSIARSWIEREQVDVIVDVPNSSVALAVAELGRSANKAVLISTAGTSALTGKNCAPTTVHWTFDTIALANSAAAGMVKAGAKRWYTIGADSAFGVDMEQRIRAVVERAGAQFVGAIRHPYNVPDFSSFLLQAHGSNVDVIAFLSGGADTNNAVKQVQEFQLEKKGIRLLTPTMTISEVESLGLEASHGLFVSEPFYWDANERTREWSKRFSAKHNGAFPTMIHAGVYAAVLHYLKAVEKADDDGGSAAVEMMKAIPTSDPLFGNGSIRADGRKIHDYYLFQVKTRAESKYSGDDYKLVQTVPGDEAFLPLAQSECPLVKK